jgi:LuxR family maltose regulon positive regulatory protein
MSTPLLSTKLYIPQPRPTLVPRYRLVERLDDGLRLGRKLTLVSAPAGFGKTTLLSEWLSVNRRASPDPGLETRHHGQHLDQGHAPGPRVAWVTLDEGDNDPARFWSYVVASLQGIENGVGEGMLATIRAPQAPAVRGFLSGFINELAQIQDPFILALDDYHFIDAEAIHDAVGVLLDYMPPQMHLVIAARADPPLNLPLLRGRGQVTEVHQADLCFSPEEVGTLLNEVMGLSLPPQSIEALQRRTEGWVTGLHLAALSMDGREDAVGFVNEFAGSHRFVLDYLTEEVLRRQPAEVQSFLLQTAVLSEMTGSLCNAVTGQEDGSQMLMRLEEAGLFVIPLDDRRQWYRYHRLFADLLLVRLLESQPERVPELHLRASAWHEHAGEIGHAVRHADAAGDTALVGRILEIHGMAMLMRGELASLLQWLSALPSETFEAKARLSILYAWTLLLAGRIDEVEPLLAQAEEALPASPADDLPGDIAAIRAYLAAQQGDVGRTLDLAEEALQLLGAGNLGMRGVVHFVQGAAYMLRGELGAAALAMAAASRTAQRGGNVHLAVPALNSLTGIQMLQGHLRQAHSTAQEGVRLATKASGQRLPFAAGAISTLAELAYEWNDLDRALDIAREGVELSLKWGNADSVCGCHLTLAQVLQARGDLEGAENALVEAERVAGQGATMSLFGIQLRALRARLYLMRGSIAQAARCLEHPPQDLPIVLRAAEVLAMARICLERDQPEKALDGLGPLLDAAGDQALDAVTVEVMSLQAMAYHAQGMVRRALDTLAQALVVAEPEGFLRRFVDQGQPMADLLQVLSAQQPLSGQGYVAQLMAAFRAEIEEGRLERGGGGAPSPDHPPSKGHRGPELLEPLSEREIEVLRLIAGGLSNREIADALYIAVSTVKSHANNIFGKLGVKSRTQAVARAQDMGLL